MDITKDKVVEWLIFALLIVFPFGQLVKMGIINGLDAITGILLVVYFLTKNKTPAFHQYARNFFAAALFSLFFSTFLFTSFNTLYGGLYLLRLVAYYVLFILIWNLNEAVRTKLFSSVFLVLGATAIFGWWQYLFYPNLTALYAWGWDDHLYRLVGTFLDPGFTGILLVFGFIASLGMFFAHKEKWYLILSLFFLVSVAFTYSRASYLALLTGASFLLSLKRKIAILLFVGLAFLGILLFIPKGVGEGQKLARSSSVYARLINYQETFEIFQKSPLLGVGFNNLCLAKQVYLGKVDVASHSCSGSDSSLLLILTTTGIAGGIIFLTLSYQIVQRIPQDLYGGIFLGSLVVLLVHSLFTNSLFYPWVMVYLAILGGKAYRE